MKTFREDFVEAVCERSGLSYSTVYRDIQNGHLKAKLVRKGRADDEEWYHDSEGERLDSIFFPFDPEHIRRNPYTFIYEYDDEVIRKWLVGRHQRGVRFSVEMRDWLRAITATLQHKAVK
jgi:hypothetical protein